MGKDSVSKNFGNDQAESNLVQPAGPNGEQNAAAQTTGTASPSAVAPAQTAPTGSASGSASGSVFGLPMNDYLYQSGIQPLPEKLYQNNMLKVGLGELGLSLVQNKVVNDSKNGDSSILINSDRVIINSKTGHTIIAGSEGVALTSINRVNIDADDSVTIYGENGIYLGVPNKGAQPEGVDPKTGLPVGAAGNAAAFLAAGKKLKSAPSPDVPYEPVVLGLKLINWLDDLCVVIKNMQILTNTGLATPREDAQWDLIALQERLKELVSSYVYVDGYSHDKMDYNAIKKPPTEEELKPRKTSIDVNANFTISATQFDQTAQPSGANAEKPGFSESNNAPTPEIK